MRKITKEATSALYCGERFNKDNTQVYINCDGNYAMSLHGNTIAVLKQDGLIISSQGWETVTTKERLNGVLSKFNMFIKQTKGTWRVYDLKGDSVPFRDGMEIQL